MDKEEIMKDLGYERKSLLKNQYSRRDTEKFVQWAKRIEGSKKPILYEIFYWFTSLTVWVLAGYLWVSGQFHPNLGSTLSISLFLDLIFSALIIGFFAYGIGNRFFGERALILYKLRKSS
jgi:hypothetical protein